MKWPFGSKHEEGYMSYPRDGQACKHFDQIYGHFSNDMRNVRPDLCADAFSPFGMSRKLVLVLACYYYVI